MARTDLHGRRCASALVILTLAGMCMLALGAPGAPAQTVPTAPQQVRLKLVDCGHFGYGQHAGHLSVTGPATLPPEGGNFTLAWTVRASKPLRNVTLKLRDLTIFHHFNRFTKNRFRYAGVRRKKSDSTTCKVPAQTGQKKETLEFRLEWHTKKSGPKRYGGLNCLASVPFSQS